MSESSEGQIGSGHGSASAAKHNVWRRRARNCPVCVADVTDDTATRPRFDDSLPARLSCRVGQQRPLTASKDATFKCHCDRAEHDCRQGNGASCGRHVALAAAGCFMRRSMVHNALRRARQLPTSRGVALGLLNGATARPVALGLPGALVAAARPLLQRCGPGRAGRTCDVHEDVSHMRGRRPVLSLDAGARIAESARIRA